MLASLGTDTDAAVADALGLTADSVNYGRRVLGIPAYGGWWSELEGARELGIAQSFGALEASDARHHRVA
jgi:hypothetical protein